MKIIKMTSKYKIRKFFLKGGLFFFLFLSMTNQAIASDNTKYYIDNVGELSESTKKEIVEKNTKLGTKGRIFVLTMEKIDEDINEYAKKAFDVFQLGDKGVLILVVKSYKGGYEGSIVVGEELKNILTEDKVDHILNYTMKPFISYIWIGKVYTPFNKVDERILDGFNEIYNIIENEGVKDNSDVKIILIFLGMFLVGIIFHIFNEEEEQI